MNVVFDFGAVLFNWRPADLLRQHLPEQAAVRFAGVVDHVARLRRLARHQVQVGIHLNRPALPVGAELRQSGAVDDTPTERGDRFTGLDRLNRERAYGLAIRTRR